MESRFNSDLSHVRIHTGAASADSAAAFQARAYTAGRDIVFGRGQYAPTTVDGKRLLAHELTHVIQQQERVQTAAIQRNGTSADLPAATPPPAAPDPSPEATPDPIQQEQKAFDVAKGRAGQPAATVLFSDPLSPSTKDSPVFETFSIADVADRNSGDPVRHGFDMPGPATAFAGLIGGEAGGAVLKQDKFYFTAKLNKGDHKLRVVAATWTEGDWWKFWRSDHVYRVTPVPGVVAVTGMGGFNFPLNQDLMDDPDKTRFLKDPAMATPADAESMRQVAGVIPVGPEGELKPGTPNEVQIPPERYEEFILGYFRSRGLEALAFNEKEAERLAEVFKPTDPGSESRTPSGVSSDAKKMIDADREQGKDYGKLLEQEARVAALLDFLRVCAERGEFPPFYPIYTKPQKPQIAAMTSGLQLRQADIQRRKNRILAVSPLVGQLVGMPDPKDRFEEAHVDRVPIPWTMEIPKLYGTNSFDESLLAKPATPETDEAIRADFEKKLDAVRKAIRSTRSEMLGDTDFLLGMDGLRKLVAQDLSRATGKNAALKDKFQEMLKSKEIKDKAIEYGEIVVQIGLLFVPGGVFLSAVAGFVISAGTMSTSLRRWTASQASVNPATALANQAAAEAQLTRSTIDLAVNAVFLATEAINGLKTLESAAGEKKLAGAIKGMEEKEAEQVTARGATASGHTIEVTGSGIRRCSPTCPLLSVEFSAELEADKAMNGTLKDEVNAAESLRISDPEAAFEASRMVEPKLVAFRGRSLVGGAVYGKLSALGLDGNAIKRILEKGLDVGNIKGRLFDELFAIEAEKKMGSEAGRKALAGAGVDPAALAKDLEFWPGSQITDIHGVELSDGILGYLEGKDLHIVNVFEAKAGQKVSTQLRVLEGRMARVAEEELTQLDKYAHDFWEELRELAEKEGKPFDLTVADVKDELMKYRSQKELGGQVRKTIERLDVSVDPAEGATGNIPTRIRLNGEEVNVVGVSGSTKVTGVLPSDVRPGKIKDALTKPVKEGGQGLNFDIMKMDITAKEIEDLAVEISEAAKAQEAVKK
jgi:hypothetical protein